MSVKPVSGVDFALPRWWGSRMSFVFNKAWSSIEMAFTDVFIYFQFTHFSTFIAFIYCLQLLTTLCLEAPMRQEASKSIVLCRRATEFCPIRITLTAHTRPLPSQADINSKMIPETL